MEIPKYLLVIVYSLRCSVPDTNNVSVIFMQYETDGYFVGRCKIIAREWSLSPRDRKQYGPFWGGD